MNELQQVLLVFAIIVVVGLYFFSRQRNQESGKPEATDKDSATSRQVKPNASEKEADPTAKNDMPEPLQPSISSTTSSHAAPAVAQTPIEDYVPENQAKLPFGEEFELTPPNLEAPQHKVLELDDMELAQEEEPDTTQQPQVFAILVLFTDAEMPLSKVSQALKLAGLTFSEKGTFVKKVNNKVVVQVANVMEPGMFPAEPIEGLTTPGVALILELPCHIASEKAINDLITFARRISQRLEGRMYDMQRHLLRESDLKAMREAALDFKTIKE